jgi:hypothetical protein
MRKVLSSIASARRLMQGAVAVPAALGDQRE